MKERGILFSAPLVRKTLADEKWQTRRVVSPKLRAQARVCFRPDAPVFGAASEAWVARAGRRYPARIAQLGAVSVETPGGWLGARPGEFDFVCPYADGRTYLEHLPGGDMRWRIDVAAGSRLWMRETFYCDHFEYDPGAGGERRAEFLSMMSYRADHDCRDWEAGCPCRDENGRSSWRPSIFMPRWASRADLDVLSVRVERLRSISDDDIRAEGVTRELAAELANCPVEAVASLRDAWFVGWCAINGRASWDANPWVWVVEFRRVRP